MRLAPLSLLLATALFGATLPFRHVAPFGLLNAFGEAAMIGGLADWFAVVALFRHPFGIPIPHTGILLHYRDRITKGIVDAVQNTWLAKETIVERLSGMRLIEPLLTSLDDDTNRRAVLRLGNTVAREALRGADTGAVASAALEQLRAGIGTADLLRWMQRSARRAVEAGRHTAALEIFAGRAAEWLQAERVRVLITANLKKIAEDYSRSTLRQVGRWMAEKSNMLNYEDLAASIIATLQADLRDLAADPAHPLRAEFDTWATGFIDGLPANESVTAMVDAWRTDLLEAEGLKAAGEKLIADLRDRMLDDLSRDDSAIMRYAEGALAQGLARFRANQQAIETVESWAKERIAHLVEEHHDQIGAIVSHNLDKLDDEQLVAQIESKVGGDLQYIRVNGAVVGGLVGAALYLLKVLVPGG
ncbi:MAG: DUF445 domain-containing protein [Ignavibacteria bacterium]|nr:DUF445 domain-containing protein [Ignavibacteria bacterium]